MPGLTYVAEALMKAWFPRSHSDPDWLNSDDGKNWAEIALLDAEVAITAYKDYLDKKYEH
jgi:hypothetical protein